MTISTNARTRVAVLLTSVGLVLALLFTLTVSASADPSGDLPPGERVVHLVRQGDTLWDIALAHLDGGDVRDLVAHIKQLNGLSSSLILPGQQLLVPTPG